MVPSGCLWLMTAAKRYKGVKGAFSANETFFVFSLQFGIGRDRRTDAAVISRWQPPRLVGLPETILKGGRDEKYLKVGEMKNTKDGRDEK